MCFITESIRKVFVPLERMGGAFEGNKRKNTTVSNLQ